MNNTIKQALFSILSGASLGYPIAWPAVDFTPPASDEWLEVAFAPNSDLDNGLSYIDKTVPRGFFQVTVSGRPNKSTFTIEGIAQQLQVVFAKGTSISGLVRVVRKPEIMTADMLDDRVSIVVSVEYSG